MLFSFFAERPIKDGKLNDGIEEIQKIHLCNIMERSFGGSLGLWLTVLYPWFLVRCRLAALELQKGHTNLKTNFEYLSQ